MSPERTRRLLVFFVALSMLSVGLNGYFGWRMYRHRIRGWAAEWKTVPPVRADDHVRGPKDAAATVIVYSDFECPYCRKLQLQLRPMADSDGFRWVFRHSPRSAHPSARLAAEASECATRQGRFWELADALSENPLAERTTDEVVRRAEAIGIDGQALRACLEKGEGAPRVASDEKEAHDLWINATPTFYVNGRRVVGLVPAEKLRRLLKK